MTLGEKLSELRARRGLSQLELAEALDVSRQSVSKWETDAAVPEIDKLIALSRYFGVPIGALLGVEPEKDADSPAPEGDLTEAQLNMVEEIVARYVDALPKPISKKRRLALKIAAAVALACLAVGLYGIGRHLERLDDNYERLQSSVNGLDSSVASRIDGITGRVEAALEEQTRITADASAQIVSTDIPGQTVTLALRATPKTFVDGMKAYFEIENNGERESVGPVEPAGAGFSCDATVALTDELKIYVVFEHDGQRETQLLDEYYDLYRDTLPAVSVQDEPSRSYTYSGNTVVSADGTWYVWVRPRDVYWGYDGAAYMRKTEIASIEVGLFRDHRLLWWAERMDGALSSWQGVDDDALFFRYPEAETEFGPGGALAKGGLCSVARVTDEYGRVFLFRAPLTQIFLADGSIENVEKEPVDWSDYETPLDPSEWDFTPWE